MPDLENPTGLTLDELKPGMQFRGTVRSLATFGAFVDIGLKEQGLIHISRMGKPVKSPGERVSVGDVVIVTVIEVNREHRRISLALVE